MAKWFYVVETNCKDVAREDEFNDWYDNIHLPDILETPGFIRATRYEIDEPVEGKGRFLAAYEIDSDDIKKTMKTLEENLTKKREQGRITDVTERVSRYIYKQISSRP
ncbi:DUF4286 family protein [Chloroflexota bacterium]